MIEQDSIVTVTTPDSSMCGRNAVVVEVVKLTNVIEGAPAHRYKLRFFTDSVPMYYFEDEVMPAHENLFGVGDTIALRAAPDKVYEVLGVDEMGNLKLVTEAGTRSMIYVHVPSSMFCHTEGHLQSEQV